MVIRGEPILAVSVLSMPSYRMLTNAQWDVIMDPNSHTMTQLEHVHPPRKMQARLLQLVKESPLRTIIQTWSVVLEGRIGGMPGEDELMVGVPLYSLQMFAQELIVWVYVHAQVCKHACMNIPK